MMARAVYVAGPFRAETVDDMADHIDAAKDVAKSVWSLGAVAVLPHTNHGWLWGNLDELVALQGCLTLVTLCDAVVLVQGWENSPGTCAEIETANRYGIPVFEDTDALAMWLSPMSMGKPN